MSSDELIKREEVLAGWSLYRATGLRRHPHGLLRASVGKQLCPGRAPPRPQRSFLDLGLHSSSGCGPSP